MEKELRGKNIVVLGAAGGVGEGIVRALLLQDATVYAAAQSQEKIDKLWEYVGDLRTGKLITLKGTFREAAYAYRFQQNLLAQVKGVDAVVASMGSWCEGKRLLEVTVEEWAYVLQNNLTSHFLAIKYLVPLLTAGGKYVHINGFAAEIPYPKAAPIAMASAAQKSMVLTLAKELNGTGISVHELILGPVNTRGSYHRRPNWNTPEEVGEYVCGILTESLVADNNVHRLEKMTTEYSITNHEHSNRH